MTNEELNTKLYEKLFAEQEEFKSWLIKQPPQEILKHAYVYGIREDILDNLKYHDLSDEQAKALLASENPLKEISHAFENAVSDYIDIIHNCIECQADEQVEIQHEKFRNLSVYIFSETFAEEHDELDKYRASHQANIDCRNAIEVAIVNHYHDNHLDSSCVHEVIDRFGMERTAFILANTVQDNDSDARISKEN